MNDGQRGRAPPKPHKLEKEKMISGNPDDHASTQNCPLQGSLVCNSEVGNIEGSLPLLRLMKKKLKNR